MMSRVAENSKDLPSRNVSALWYGAFPNTQLAQSAERSDFTTCDVAQGEVELLQRCIAADWIEVESFPLR